MADDPDDDRLEDDDPSDEDERQPAADASEEAEDVRPRTRQPIAVAPALRMITFGLLVLLGSLIGGAVVRWIAMIVQPETVPDEVIEVRPTADVVTAVRDLARLETTSFHIERVIDLTSRQSRLFGLIEAQDSILLVAASDVVAGVDLAELRDGDVTIEPEAHRAILTLPPPRIFSARLDNDRTYVYGRTTDALARRRQNLETRARQEAERTLEEAALEAGILDRARENARRTVSGLVSSLGYDEVIIRFRDEEG